MAPRPGTTFGQSLPYCEAPPVAPGDPKVIQSMANLLSACDPGSDAEALKMLRGAYPDLPLALRIAALAMRRGNLPSRDRRDAPRRPPEAPGPAR